MEALKKPFRFLGHFFLDVFLDLIFLFFRILNNFCLKNKKDEKEKKDVDSPSKHDNIDARSPNEKNQTPTQTNV